MDDNRRSTTQKPRNLHQRQPSAASSIASNKSEGNSAHHNASNEPNKKVTVEDSIKTFYVIEALRNGNVDYILKFLTSPDSEGDESSSSEAIKARKSTDTSATHNHHHHGHVLTDGKTILHFAVQVASIHTIDFILKNRFGKGFVSLIDINAQDNNSDTALHLAAKQGRSDVIAALLNQPDIDDTVVNKDGKQPIDVAASPEIAEQMQLARVEYIVHSSEQLKTAFITNNYPTLDKILSSPRARALLDINGQDPETGFTVLHDAVRNHNIDMVVYILANGGDPFRRDRKGKLPIDYCKNDAIRKVLKQATNNQAVLDGSNLSGDVSAPPKMRGYLKKWTNYKSGYKLRYFVLENNVLSYFKNQEDTNSNCRGSINMRLASVHVNGDEKCKFEVLSKGNVRYHLRANHAVESNRWVWALTRAIQSAKDIEKASSSQQHHTPVVKAGSHPGSKPPSIQTNVGTVSENGAVTVPHSPSNSIAQHSLSERPSRGRVSSSSSISSTKAPTGTTISHVATQSDDDDDEEDYSQDGDAILGEEPHKVDLPISQNQMRVELEVLKSMSQATRQERDQEKKTGQMRAQLDIALSAYEKSVIVLTDLFNTLVIDSSEREKYFKNKAEKEMSLRKMWEQNILLMEEQTEKIEANLYEAVKEKKQYKRAYKDMVAKTGGESASKIEKVSSAGKEEAVQTDSQQTGLKNARVTEPQDSSDESDDDDDEFFDVMEQANRSDGNLPRLDERDESSSQPEQQKPSTSEEKNSQEEKKPPGGAVDNIAEGQSSEAQKKSAKSGSAVAAPHKVNQEYDKESSMISKTIAEAHTPIQKAICKAVIVSFHGYEDGPRTRLPIDADNRPSISLWGILKNLVGKDMTRMTLPVSFNECTSLTQRVAEDMEYTDLLDKAAASTSSTERLLYVAAFAASGYSSTIDRVAKPFNPLLGETYEYCRPDKGYRFFLEQVTHHPPVGAACAQSPCWDYYGESSVKSRFNGRSFDFNPLGTWTLVVRPNDGKPPETITWKKVTSSVVGIITGSPVVDNYGDMIVQNHTTGDVCKLKFKARGWRGSNAYEVHGHVFNSSGKPEWTLAGHWNSKIFAKRSNSSSDEDQVAQGPNNNKNNNSSSTNSASPAFLIWQANPRPREPFNLTPFAITLNALPDKLKPYLAPTDTRLRPDQRAMENGEYDDAAILKDELEKAQRARRREREESGDDYKPRWFKRAKHPVTNEIYWQFTGEYWNVRQDIGSKIIHGEKVEWPISEQIFDVDE